MPYVSDVAVGPIVRFEVGSFEMFKKFVSNALLSIVIDKKARDKMSAANEPKVTSTPDVENENIPSMTPEMEAPPERSAAPNQHLPVEDEDPKKLISEALACAREELLHKQDLSNKGTSITRERAALIKQAMAIRQSKLYILDGLTQDQRNRLTYMAIQALNDQTDK
ncbi:MAG: hypothetical protein CMF67_13150 [Magnetovibrio sp.]|nr:hypothetical protein [Magnetovibrio sp.]